MIDSNRVFNFKFSPLDHSKFAIRLKRDVQLYQVGKDKSDFNIFGLMELPQPDQIIKTFEWSQNKEFPNQMAVGLDTGKIMLVNFAE